MKTPPELTQAVPKEQWTFLTNHAHVLICLAHMPEYTVREVALSVGITERAVQRIIGELENAGFLSRERIGRRTRYSIHADKPLRHRLEAHCSLGDLLNAL
ncbi:MAG: helix-turn-helix transcriptional regulator [Candidatus Sericytochromatia bacterium]